MDLDFPLILVAAVFVTGGIWLLDLLILAPRRSRKSLGRTAKAVSDRDPVEGEPRREPVLVEYAKSFFPVLFVVLVLRSFLYEPFQIPSGSMLPTLKIGDFILVNKYTYGLRLPVLGTKVVPLNNPQRGDVIVFKFPGNHKINFIKRVVGVSGDTVTYQDKQIYINNQLIPQQLVAQLPPLAPEYQVWDEQLDDTKHQIYRNIGPSMKSGEWLVPQGHYFVMGDNRDNSNDSRYWGFVPDELVVGKASLIWMHWNKFWSIPGFASVGAID